MQTNHLAPTHGVAPQPHDGRVNLAPAHPEKLLRLPAVCEQTGLGKSSIYAMPDFPKPLVLSRRAVAWRQSEVSAWIESRTKRADAKP